MKIKISTCNNQTSTNDINYIILPSQVLIPVNAHWFRMITSVMNCAHDSMAGATGGVSVSVAHSPLLPVACQRVCEEGQQLSTQWAGDQCRKLQVPLPLGHFKRNKNKGLVYKMYLQV